MRVSQVAPFPSAALAIMPNDLPARGLRHHQLPSLFKLNILKRAETSIPHLFTDEETFPNRQPSHFFFLILRTTNCSQRLRLHFLPIISCNGIP